jgi:hydrogenase maturation protease
MVFPRTLVVGCGSSLAGDDAAGPELIRRLAARQLPPSVACVDAGTSGFEVVLRMQGVPEVILVDACASGDEPGVIHEVAGESLDASPASAGVSIHRLRWDQAIALSRPLFGDATPRLTTFLVEGCRFTPGEGLSPEVDRAVDRLVDLLAERLSRMDA